MSKDEIMNDLQMPEPEDRKLEKAIQRLRLLYVEAKHTPLVKKPLAWALHRVWMEVDRYE